MPQTPRKRCCEPVVWCDDTVTSVVAWCATRRGVLVRRVERLKAGSPKRPRLHVITRGVC
jgi:hypothetical protein